MDTATGKSARGKNALSYVLLIAAFGVVVPWVKGLDFFNAQLLAAYACMGTVFAGPMAAQAFRNKPASFGEAMQWIVQAVLIGEGLVAAMLVCGILTVYLSHLHKVFFGPDLPALGAAMALGVAGSLALASWAAWLTVQFTAGIARGGLRVVFLGLLVLFFFRGQWLPRVTGVGTLIALAAAAVFVGLLRVRLRPNAEA